MKIGIVSSKLGYITRGFESFSSSLARVLAPTLEVVVYAGAPADVPGIVVLRSPRMDSRWLRLFSSRESRRMRLQEQLFALPLVAELRKRPCDVLIVSECAVGEMLHRIRRFFPFPGAVVFSNGAPAPPQYYPPADYIHQVHSHYFQEAIDAGYSPSRMETIPYGIDCQSFSIGKSKQEARAEYGFPQDKRILLCCAAIKSEHKRIDWLIRETARLDDGAFLVVAGQRTSETATLETLATALLNDRFRFVSVRHADMPTVYAAADQFVLTSLTEGLGIVILEAMAAGLPVLVHDSEFFHATVQDRQSLVDMTDPGALANKITSLWSRPEYAAALGRRNAILASSNYDWSVLVPRYVAMLESAVAQSSGSGS